MNAKERPYQRCGKAVLAIGREWAEAHVSIAIKQFCLCNPPLKDQRLQATVRKASNWGIIWVSFVFVFGGVQ
jgi:hypothetical protein